MRLLGITAGFFAAFLLTAPSASAATLTASGEIRITAVVAPVHYIIVNEDGDIIDITSNTDEDAAPKVYRDKVAAGNEVQLTRAIYQDYRAIVPAGKSRIGKLYAKVPASEPVSLWQNYLKSSAGGFSLLRNFH